MITRDEGGSNNAEALARNIEHLRTAQNCSCERLCERAAILEFCAGMPHHEAELMAAAWAANWGAANWVRGTAR